MGFLSHDYLASLSQAERDLLLLDYIKLGYHPETHDTLFQSQIDRFSGTCMQGIQGSGKSGLLENMIIQDIEAGHAVIVIDPHGDLADKCIAGMSAERLAKTYLLDLLDEEHPYGINIFGLSGKPRTHKEKAQAVDRVMHVFDVLWEDVLKQANMPLYVKTATIALIYNPNMTLMHMRRFLTDRAFRMGILKNVHDRTVHEFWAEHDNLSDAQQNTRISPLLNRLGAIFIGRDLIQNIVGQRTTISFRRAIENKEVIFIKLPTTVLEQDAKLIGTIMVAQISAALFSFGDLPEAQRPGVSLFIDEFQNFASPDAAKLFSEGRKFGMRVVLAHQFRAQLPDWLQDATATSQTKICFKLNADDAREMAHYFPVQGEAEVKPEDIEPRVSDYLLKFGSDDPHIRRFIDIYLRPLQVHRRGGKVDIEDRQLTWKFNGGLQYEDFFVSDPTPYLDSLLYEVMRTKNPHLAIPWDAVVGFANCGRKFFSVARGAKDSRELTSGVLFPKSCVVMHGETLHWVKVPSSAAEQFYHFIFHLRMMMFHLAEHPIGKRSQPNSTLVAQWLSTLPRRSAFVRSGDDVGMIYTFDTPPHLTGSELAARMQAIQAQTRAKYCHRRAEVEQLFRNPDKSPPAPQPDGTTTVPITHDPLMLPISGWGEVDEP